MRDLLTTTEVATIVGVTDSRIRQLILSKVLPAQKFGNTNLVRREDLKLLENRRSGRPRKKAA